MRTTTVANPESYLVVQKNGTVAVRSVPFGHSDPVDFGALVILASLHQYEAHIERRENRLAAHKAKLIAHGKVSRLDFPKTRPEGIFKITHDTLTIILNFLLATNALRL